MTFNATDPSEKPIKGIIIAENDEATVTFTDSTWVYIHNGDAYKYLKSKE